MNRSDESVSDQAPVGDRTDTTEDRLRAALVAYGHHADDCAYALTVCTCGFSEAMRSLIVEVAA